jgi:hypothetical protein
VKGTEPQGQEAGLENGMMCEPILHRRTQNCDWRIDGNGISIYAAITPGVIITATDLERPAFSRATVQAYHAALERL